MERLIEAEYFDAVLDVTTTELADELVGGIHPAGPQRLRTAGRLGIPQVVSVGALDMVNFGPRDTVPRHLAGRTIVAHNPQVTLIRTTAEECAELGARLAERLRGSSGPVSVYLRSEVSRCSQSPASRFTTRLPTEHSLTPSVTDANPQWKLSSWIAT